MSPDQGVVTVRHGYFVGEALKLLTCWRHSFDQDGAMHLAIKVEVAAEMPSLPRIGALLWLTDEVLAAGEEVSWLGRGPNENYPDRLLAADLGRWQSPLDALHTAYVFPTDNGLRCDTRQLRFGSIEVEGLFHFSLSRFSQQQLAQARHQTDLVAAGGLHLCLDGFHMGIEGMTRARAYGRNIGCNQAATIGTVFYAEPERLLNKKESRSELQCRQLNITI